MILRFLLWLPRSVSLTAASKVETVSSTFRFVNCSVLIGIGSFKDEEAELDIPDLIKSSNLHS